MFPNPHEVTDDADILNVSTLEHQWILMQRPAKTIFSAAKHRATNRRGALMPPAPSKRMAKQLVKTRPAQTDWFSIDFYRMAFHFVPSKALDRSIKFHMKLTNSLTIKSEYRHHFASTVVISQIGSTKICQCSINNHAFPCPRTSIQTLT